MKLFFIEYIILSIIFFEKSYKSIIIKKNNNSNSNFNGIYIISNSERNLHFSIEYSILILSNIKQYFRLILVNPKSYLIESREKKKIIGVDEKDNIKIYNKIDNINKNKIYWNIIKIRKMKFLLQNHFNKNFLEAKDNRLKCSRKINFNDFKKKNKTLDKKYIFRLFKLFQEVKVNNSNIIKKEPVDAIIKYIDLSDKELKRDGIIQIYKDENNEELKYSIRSIIQYIPWIRKIYILMPNEKVKFLKSEEIIKEKIIYIKDKDILGFDSANIHSFTFNLYKMEKFNISKNFIYFEDDFFIGKRLEKKDFFYYDIKNKKVFPFILTYHFNEINITELLKEYNDLDQKKHLIHPHSGEGWRFSILNTQKYFLEKYKFPILNTKFTHNAIAENINDLKEIFEEIKDYKYINETLLAKERNILTLNKPQFLNLYTLNIKKRKVHSIEYKYIPIELINKIKLNMALFVLNTGGNHKPLKRHYSWQKKIMSKRFPFYTKYEILNDKEKHIFNSLNKKSFFILKILLMVNIIKIYFLIELDQIN